MRNVSILFVSVLWPAICFGQQTIFNVPSADVLARGTFYVENDWYIRPWETSNGRLGITYARGVVGVGGNVEVGLNLGAFDILHQNNSFIDFAAKWRPWTTPIGNGEKPGTLGVIVGNHAGIGLQGAVAGDGRDFVYGMGFLSIPVYRTRFGAGAYFATKEVFGGESRVGIPATFEQPLPWIENLVLAADWLSGDGGYLTPGFIYSYAPLTMYVGYGLANLGRRDDQVTVEIGLTF